MSEPPESRIRNPESIFITGICGFVGSVLARELRRLLPDCEIHGIDNFIRAGSETNLESLQRLGCRIVKGDIRNPENLEDIPPVDWVIDCAANPSVLAGVDGRTGSKELLDHNLVGTIHLLEYCKKHKAGFILMSTSRVYSIEDLSSIPVKPVDGAFVLAETVTGKKLHVSRDESAPKEPATCHLLPVTKDGVTESFSTAPPLSLYGMSKLCAEGLALEYGSAFAFPVWINRCGVLAGAGQFGRADQGIFAYWINAWLRGKPLKYIGFEGLGYQVRDCLHPRDLAPLLLEQMMDPQREVARIQNLSGGRANSMSLLQLSQWCERRFPELERQPVLCDAQPRPFDIPWMVLDASLAGKQWGWKPATPIESILEEIAAHAEANPGWLELSGV